MLGGNDLRLDTNKADAVFVVFRFKKNNLSLKLPYQLTNSWITKGGEWGKWLQCASPTTKLPD